MYSGLGRGLSGGWTKLAVIKRAVHRRKNVGWLRLLLHRRLGDLLEMGPIQRRYPDVWEDLLEAPCSGGSEGLRQPDVDPGGETCAPPGDDPVPEAVVRALDR